MSVTSLALLTALFWGLAPIVAKVGLAKIDPVSALIIRSITITTILVIVGLIGGYFHKIVSADWRSVTFIATEGILASLIGHFTYFAALRSGMVAKVVPLSATFPLFALVFAFIILSEKVTLLKIVGAALIVLGSVLVRW